MTKQETYTVLSLRGKGLTYCQIGARLGIPANTVKSICRREAEKKQRCRNCRRPLVQHDEGRPRMFCSNDCRIIWWKEHPDQINRKAFYQLTCANCGRQFDSYGHKKRKYCSHQCYIEDRFGPP